MNLFTCFNLVIEMLFFSSREEVGLAGTTVLFQSRNRDAFLFKRPLLFFWLTQWLLLMFQSRNRDAFLFKETATSLTLKGFQSFNLVIEMLFFSSGYGITLPSPGIHTFQSRNRDAFLFKGQDSRLPIQNKP